MWRLDILAHHKRASGDWAISGRVGRRSDYLPNSRTSYNQRQWETRTRTCGRCSVSTRALISVSVSVRVEVCYSASKSARKSLSERWADDVCASVQLLPAYKPISVGIYLTDKWDVENITERQKRRHTIIHSYWHNRKRRVNIDRCVTYRSVCLSMYVCLTMCLSVCLACRWTTAAACLISDHRVHGFESMCNWELDMMS